MQTQPTSHGEKPPVKPRIFPVQSCRSKNKKYEPGQSRQASGRCERAREAPLAFIVQNEPEPAPCILLEDVFTHWSQASPRGYRRRAPESNRVLRLLH
jgi:hypothetical protein